MDVYRILKRGGAFEVWTVDFEKVVIAYLKREIPDSWFLKNPDKDIMQWVNGRIFAYDQNDGKELNLHRACFDEIHLRSILTKAGFKNVEALKHPRGADHGFINLGLRGVK